MRIFTISIAAVILLLVVACSDSGGSEPQGTADDGGATGGGQSTPAASQFAEHLVGSLPAEFPADFPIYAGAEIARGDTIDDRYAIDLRSSDDLETVVDYYRDGLSTAPWRITDEEPGDGSVIFTYESEDGAFRGEVAVGKLQERTWVLIAMTPEEAPAE